MGTYEMYLLHKYNLCDDACPFHEPLPLRRDDPYQVIQDIELKGVK